MMRLLRAFAWLRWRLLVNSFRASGRRDSLERVSRALSAILPILLAVLFVPAILGGAVLATAGGWGLGTGRVDATGVITSLRIILAIFTVALVVAPAIRSARGVSSGLARFITLPIPLGFLYMSDAVLALFDPWFMILIPVLLMFPVGLAAAGQFAFAALALLGGALFLVLLLALETSISNVLNLLYRNRRRGEAATVIIFFCLSLLGTAPLLINRFTDSHRGRRAGTHKTGSEDVPPAPAGSATSEDGSSNGSNRSSPNAPTGSPSGPDSPRGSVPHEPSESGRSASSAESSSAPSALGTSPDGRAQAGGFPTSSRGWRALAVPLQVFPSEVYGRAISRAHAGRLGAAALQIGLLAAIAAALAGASWTTYGRLLSTPDISGRFGKGTKSRTLALRLPGLNGASSAVSVATAKVILRSVSGKMAVYFSPVSMVLLMFVLTRVPTHQGGGGLGLDQLGAFIGPVAAGIGGFFCLITMQRFMLNQYAIDGPGATMQLLGPLSGREIVVGKFVGMGLLFAIPCAVYVLAAFIFLPRAPLLLWATVLVSIFGMYVLYAPITSMLAALFPRAADLSRIGKSSNPSTPAAMTGLAVSAACFAPFAAADVLTFAVWKSPLLSFVIALVCAGAAFLLSTQLVVVAGRVLDSRRENLALVAQGR